MRTCPRRVYEPHRKGRPQGGKQNPGKQGPQTEWLKSKTQTGCQGENAALITKSGIYSWILLIMEGNRIKIGTSYRVKRMGLLWMKNRYGLFWG